MLMDSSATGNPNRRPATQMSGGLATTKQEPTSTIAPARNASLESLRRNELPLLPKDVAELEKLIAILRGNPPNSRTTQDAYQRIVEKGWYLELAASLEEFRVQFCVAGSEKDSEPSERTAVREDETAKERRPAASSSQKRFNATVTARSGKQNEHHDAVAVRLADSNPESQGHSDTVQGSRQLPLPSWREFEHVEAILAKVRRIKKALRAPTHEVENGSSKKSTFSPDVVEIAQAFYRENRDVAKVPKWKILKKARDLISARALALAKQANKGLKGAVAPRSRSSLATTDPLMGKASSASRNPRMESEGSQCREAARSERQPDHASRQSEAVVAIPGAAIPLPDALEDFTRDIKRLIQDQHSRFVGDAIAIGEAFVAAAQKYGQKLRELAHKAELDYTTVTQYVKVAERFGPGGESWARAQLLPPSVDSVMRLARLKPDEFEDAVKKGKVHPGMGRKEVKNLLTEYRPASAKTPQKGEDQSVENRTVAANLEATPKAPAVAQQSAKFSDTLAQSPNVLASSETVDENTANEHAEVTASAARAETPSANQQYKCPPNQQKIHRTVERLWLHTEAAARKLRKDEEGLFYAQFIDFAQRRIKERMGAFCSERAIK